MERKKKPHRLLKMFRLFSQVDDRAVKMNQSEAETVSQENPVLTARAGLTRALIGS